MAVQTAKIEQADGESPGQDLRDRVHLPQDGVANGELARAIPARKEEDDARLSASA